MTYSEKFDRRPYIVRKYFGDSIYFEVVALRLINGRGECLSRFNLVGYGGSSIETFGYRWRKVCGKGVLVPSLGREAKDDHNPSLTIRHPITGKMNRVYLQELKRW